MAVHLHESMKSLHWPTMSSQCALPYLSQHASELFSLTLLGPASVVPCRPLACPEGVGQQKQSPAGRGASQRPVQWVEHSLSGVEREQQYGTFGESRRVEQKFTSHLSKPWTTEWAMLKGDNEHASLLLVLHQTSEFLAQCTRPTLLSHPNSSYGSHALLGPFLCTLSLAIPAC